MTREEIKRAAREYIYLTAEKDSDCFKLEAAFFAGARFVDSHRWISVEDELPKEHEWILGFSLKRSYIDVYNFDSNGLIEAHDITHWMHLSPPPVLSNSENTGKDLSDNCGSCLYFTESVGYCTLRDKDVTRYDSCLKHKEDNG